MTCEGNCWEIKPKRFSMLDRLLCSFRTRGSQDNKSQGFWNEKSSWNSKDGTTKEVTFFRDFVPRKEGITSFNSRGKFVEVETYPKSKRGSPTRCSSELWWLLKPSNENMVLWISLTYHQINNIWSKDRDLQSLKKKIEPIEPHI